MKTLLPLAEEIGALLKARKETVAVAESSSGGLISAALLSVPGASKYFVSGGVVYTPKARARLMDIAKDKLTGMRSSSEPYAMLLAQTARDRFGTTWGLSETGAAGPTGNPYGDAAGHTCIAVAGAIETATTIETQSDDRVENMRAFAKAALELLLEGLNQPA